MAIEEITALDVPALVDDNAHLYLWTTNAFIPTAFEVCEAWGFRPITLLTWIKTTEEPLRPLCEACVELGCPMHQESVCKQCEWPPRMPLEVGTVRVSGRAGYYYRGATEHCLFGVKGSQKLLTDEALPTAFLWHRKPHSVKPDPFYDLVERVSPGPYLELFARRNRLNWETWGDEALEHVVLGPDSNVVALNR